MMLVRKRSLFSGKLNEMDLDVTPEQLAEFSNPNRTRLVQDIFPNLTEVEREFLMTGATEEEWNEYMIDKLDKYIDSDNEE